MAYKISRVVKCSCGWLHIVQGPASCWVCMDSVSHQLWQTGKPEPERLKKPRCRGTELNLNGEGRWWNPDPRDPIKDQLTEVRRGQGYFVRAIREVIPGYDRCFAGDDRWDWETRSRFEFNPGTTKGFVVINKQFGL